jgi:invasion protein IalB
MDPLISKMKLTCSKANVYIVRLLLNALILLFFTTAQAADDKILLSGSTWIEDCPNETDQTKKNCVLEQSIYVGQEKKVRVITINIEILKGGDETVLRLRVPLETLLQPEIIFEISENLRFKIPLIFCDPTGCYGELKLGKEGLRSLMMTKNLIVTYYHLRSNSKDKAVKLNIDANDLKFKLEDLVKKTRL